MSLFARYLAAFLIVVSFGGCGVDHHRALPNSEIIDAQLVIDFIPESGLYFHHITRSAIYTKEEATASDDSLWGIAHLASVQLSARAFMEYDTSLVRFTDSTIVPLRIGRTPVVFRHEHGRDTTYVEVSHDLVPRVVGSLRGDSSIH